MELQIIDEWLLTILTQEQAVHIFEIIESRLKTPSTIFCTQYSLEGWHEKIDNIQITDAILDRIVHDSYKIWGIRISWWKRAYKSPFSKFLISVEKSTPKLSVMS